MIMQCHQVIKKLFVEIIRVQFSFLIRDQNLFLHLCNQIETIMSGYDDLMKLELTNKGFRVWRTSIFKKKLYLHRISEPDFTLSETSGNGFRWGIKIFQIFFLNMLVLHTRKHLPQY